MRDARRTARRARLWWFRLGFSAPLLLIGLLWLPWKEVHIATLATDAREGNSVLAWLMMLLVFAVAPVLGALAMVEERDDASGDLLAMTRMRPYQLFIGKLGARLLGLQTTLLSVLPLLAVGQSFGGVTTGELLLAVAAPLWIALLLASVSAVLATSTRQVTGPIVLTWAWGITVFLVLPLVAGLEFARGGSTVPQFVSLTSPLFAHAALTPNSGIPAGDALPAFVLTAPMLLPVLLRGGAAMNLAVGGGEVASGADRRWLRYATVTNLLALLAIPPLVKLATTSELRLAAITLLLVLVTGAWLDLGAAVLRGKGGGARQGRVYHLLRWLTPPTRTLHPLLARAAFGGGHGPKLSWVAALAFGWALVSAWLLWRTVTPPALWGPRAVDLRSEWFVVDLERVLGIATTLPLVVAAQLTASAATGGVDEERREGAGELLSITTTSTAKLLGAKLFGTLVRTAPLVLEPIAFSAATLVAFALIHLRGANAYPAEVLFPVVPLLTPLLFAAWILAVWLTLALGATAIALAVPSRRVAWAANLGALALVPAVSAAFLANYRVEAYVWPFLDDHWWSLRGAPLSAIVAPAVWLLAASVLALVNLRLLRWRYTRGS